MGAVSYRNPSRYLGPSSSELWGVPKGSLGNFIKILIMPAFLRALVYLYLHMDDDNKDNAAYIGR